MPYLIRFAALIITVIAGASCSGARSVAPKSSTDDDVVAEVVTVAKIPVTTAYEAVGTVRSKDSSVIQSKAVGHILAIHVKEGDAVQVGQLLLELDDRDATAQVQRAEAALKQAREARRAAAGSVQAALHAKTAADATGDLARATYQRYKGLVDQRAVSQQTFDEANARWRGATAAAAQAGDFAVSAQAQATEAEARVQQAEAELSAAKTGLTYTRITAPFAGVVTRKTVAVGDLAAPGAPLLELEDAQHYRLEALVDEARAANIKLGATTPVSIDALSEPAITGTVSEIVPAADSASRTFLIKVELPERPGIRSGMFGRAAFAESQKELLTVPESALVRQGQLTGVYVVGADDKIARLRLITTGKRYGENVEALSGLRAGERIVARSTGQITDGAAIRNG